MYYLSYMHLKFGGNQTAFGSVIPYAIWPVGQLISEYMSGAFDVQLTSCLKAHEFETQAGVVFVISRLKCVII